MGIRNTFEYIGFRALVGCTRRIPFALLCPFLMTLLDRIYRVGLLRRRVLRTNLSVVLGDGAPAGRIDAAARRCAAEHGRMIAELLHEHRFNAISGDSFPVIGIEHLRDAVSTGRGVIILTGHFGNMILAGYQVAKLGFPLAYVSRSVRNPMLRVEFEKVYTKYGNRIIPIRSSRNDPAGGLKIMKLLRRGEILVVINDQDAGREGYRCTFFGMPTYVPSGPAHFAYRTGAVVITGFAMRREDRPALELQGPIDYSQAGTLEDAEARILEEYTRRLEAKVRESPELYFWYHKKWKSDPGIRARYAGN